MEATPTITVGRKATPAEDKEFEQAMSDARETMISDFDEHIRALKEYVRHQEYFDALLEAHKITKVIFELSRWF
jgi:hypothetical protein